MCSQSRYDGLVTCLLFDFSTASKPVDFITVANATCQHHLIKNTSFCDVVEIQQRLLAILNDTDPREVLCRENTTLLIYDTPELQKEVHDPICNMTLEHLQSVFELIVIHFNLTEVSRLYFPDGMLELELIAEIAIQLQELRQLPTVQVHV